LRQNIGLILLTSGSIILGISVFSVYLRRFYQLEWDKIPWEVRLFCRLIRIDNKTDYFEKLLVGAKEYILPDDKIKLGDRIKTDLPIIALFLMVVGILLCLNYSAFCRFF
jgi:hypothetical protein